MLSGFWKDERGNFAVILALVLVPVIAIAGTAVDYSHMQNRKEDIRSAADSAILAAARDASDFNEFKRLTRDYMTANLPGYELDLTYTINPGSVTMGVDSPFKTSFMGMVGAGELPISLETEVVTDRFGPKAANLPAGGEMRQALEQLGDARRRALRNLGKLPPRYHDEARAAINRQFDQYASMLGKGATPPVHLAR